MSALPNCPKCSSEYTYEDGSMLVCPMCAHEWSPAAEAEAAEANVIRDANGNILADGDTVTVIKDLKVKGSSSAIKQGTKVKGIRLVHDSANGHDIDCKIDGNSIYIKKGTFIDTVYNSYNDHRIAMACMIIKKYYGCDVKYDECLSKSYPDFLNMLNSL